MSFRFHGFYFMLYTGRAYTEFSLSLGYNGWSGDVGFRLTLPLLMLSFGYEIKENEMIAAEPAVAGK